LLNAIRTPQVKEALDGLKVTGPLSCIIVGIESHICVTQTTIDLLKAGHKVYVIADGVSSCNKEEVPIALARLRHEGAIVTTSESFIYECMGDASTPEYVQALCGSFLSHKTREYLSIITWPPLTPTRFKQIIKVVKENSNSTKDVLQTLCKI
jgi:hypothetical protein